MTTPLGDLSTPATTLPTGRVEGNPGHVAWTNTLHRVANDLTAPGGIKGGSIGATQIAYDHLTGQAVAKLTGDILALAAAAAVPSGGGVPPTVSIPDTKVATRLASTATTAVAGVFAGSSSTAGEKASTKAGRFVDRVTVGVQLTRPSGRASGGPQSLETYVQDLVGGVGGFTAPDTTPGFHGYNVGRSGSEASTFIYDADIAAVCALNPAFWAIMIGSNDCANGVSPATYKTNLAGKLAKIKAAMPADAQYAIYLVHQYQRPALRNPTYPWALYGQALAELAAADPTVVRFVDLSAALPNIPGPDNATALATGDIDADLIHMTTQGHGKWAAAEYAALFGQPLPAGAVTYTAAGVVDGVELFPTPSATTLGAAWNPNGDTWAVDPSNRAYLAAGSNGVATRAVGLSDGELSFDLTYPTAAGSFAGVRARATGKTSGVSLYVNRDAGTVNLSTIIGSSNALLTAAVAVPAGTVAGTVLACRLVFVGAAISGYVAGAPVLSGTLTPAQQGAITGTDIAVRQLTSGANNGMISNVRWSSSVGSTAPPTTVTVDTVTSQSNTAVASSGNLTFAHTVNAGVTLLVVAAEASASSNASTTTTVTYGGVAMTSRANALSSTSSTARQAIIWTLANPPVGTANVVVTVRSAGGPFTVAATAMSVLGAAGTFGTPATQVSASASSATVTTSSAATDVVVVVVAARSTTAVAGGAATSRYNQLLGTNGAFAVSTSVGGAALAATYTWAVAGEVAIVALPLIAATAAAPFDMSLQIGNLPGWDQTVAEPFDTAVASPDFLTVYGPRGWRTYNGFGDTAWNKSGGVVANSGWYSDRALSVANGELTARIGWDSVLGKNVVTYFMPRGYTGHICGRVDWVMISDVIAGYKIVPLWWSAANPDVWSDGELDYPESNTLGTTFKAYGHNVTGSPQINEFAIEPVMIPGNPVAPRLDVLHAFSFQWTEAEISGWLDGVKCFGVTYASKPNVFPVNPMRFGFQIEALDLGGTTPISRTALGSVKFKHVAMYSRNLATA